MRCLAIQQLVVLILLLGGATAEAQLRPFRDRDKARWGYKRPDGSVAISPRYVGAGKFRIGLECYVRELRASGPALGGRIIRRPPGGEASSSAVVLKLPSGVLVIEDIGYEGFRRRVVLPGVSAAEAAQWRRKLYPDTPSAKIGCSESWSSGAVQGGAFIEQSAGC